MKLSHSISGGQTVFVLACKRNGWLSAVRRSDYFDEFRESPSLLEAVYAVFINNLEID